MATLVAIQKQIAVLQKQADALRQSEAKEAAAKARELIEAYGLTAEDLGLAVSSGRGKARGTAVRGGKAVARTKGEAKYRDPVSGKTWTGVGKQPRWIAGVADRTPFLIGAPAAAVVAPAPAPAPVAKKAKLAAAKVEKAVKTDKAADKVAKAPKAPKAAKPAKAPAAAPKSVAKAPAKSAAAPKAPKAPKPAATRRAAAAKKVAAKVVEAPAATPTDAAAPAA